MKILILTVLIFSNISVFPQNNHFDGVLNSTKTDKSFGQGQESIKESILDNIFNLNLFEYAHSLNELYELLYSNKLSMEDWENYVEILQNEVIQAKKDTICPFYAIDYKKIIPLQAEYFISSLERNSSLKRNYPIKYRELRKCTSKLIGQGYSFNEIDSLLVISPKKSTVGTVNFWFFVQLYGCPIIEKGFERAGVERIGMLMSNLDITSTYKVPLQLQLRKVRSMNQVIKGCLNDYEIVFKPKIIVMDKDKDYYKKHLDGGLNLDKMKEF